MKRVNYFIIPNRLKYGVLAILAFYIIKYYETIEFYKYLIIFCLSLAIVVIRKINERYIKWDSEMIIFKIPNSKEGEVIIKITNISTIKIEEYKGMLITLNDNSSHYIPFESLGKNYNIDVDMLVNDFQRRFSNLLIN